MLEGMGFTLPTKGFPCGWLSGLIGLQYLDSLEFIGSISGMTESEYASKEISLVTWRFLR